MGKKRKALSEAEIWDDSALIQSWDEALEEYRLYHSIHARGERVEDVLLAAQHEEQSMNGMIHSESKESSAPSPKNNESLEDGELKDHEASILNQAHSVEDQKVPHPTVSESVHQPSETQRAGPAHGMIEASSQDAALKNLMMSWYWAGYYTGLYEGQKQATQTAQEAVSGDQQGRA